MTKFERLLIQKINEYIHENSIEDLFERVFPDMSIGELFLDMYEAGLIPTQDLEDLLDE